MYLMAVQMLEDMKTHPHVAVQRVQEEERRVFKYYSEYLEKNLKRQVCAILDDGNVQVEICLSFFESFL